MTLEQHLVLLDMTVAYTLGAPQGHTLSSNAWRLAAKGSPMGLAAVAIIDLPAALLGQKWHCFQAYQNAVERIRLAQEKG